MLILVNTKPMPSKNSIDKAEISQLDKKILRH
jgi:hypothetical protein